MVKEPNTSLSTCLWNLSFNSERGLKIKWLDFNFRTSLFIWITYFIISSSLKLKIHLWQIYMWLVHIHLTFLIIILFFCFIQICCQTLNVSSSKKLNLDSLCYDELILFAKTNSVGFPNTIQLVPNQLITYWLNYTGYMLNIFFIYTISIMYCD